jgi:penicillin-binding protein 2
MFDPFLNYKSKQNHSEFYNSLDWEEAALQTSEDPEDYYEGHNNEPRSFLFGFFMVVAFSALFIRLGILQVVNGPHYRALAEGNRLRVQYILAPRGIIYDRNDKPIVQNVPNFELVLTPADLPKEGFDSEIDSLAALTAVPAEEIRKKIENANRNSFQAISIATSLTKEATLVFESRASEFPGFTIQNNPIRNYPNPLVYSHLLGYTGKINDRELAAHKDEDYLFNDFIGKNGIEDSYEKYLRGIAGQKQVEVDASAKIKSVIGEIPPTPGNSLVLNIDSELQQRLYDEMVKKNGSHKGAAVAIDPQSGKVLALVSLPGYDTNLFARGISQTNYQALLNSPDHPLLNRTVSGTYPPGSTIKPALAAAVLEEKVVTPETKIFDNGDLVYGGYHFRGWKLSGLGPMDVRSAIAMSSDIYFYTVGGGQERLSIEGLGPERMAKYYELFGMGQRLGIDIQGEATGLIGSPEWRKNRYKERVNQMWYIGDTYHQSIGQGDMLATPLQVAMWTVVVANGGTLYKPYIADKVIDSEGKVVMKNQPEVIRAGFISPQNIEVVREGMKQTVTTGTARSFATLPITSGGKTGTAQFDGADLSRTHAWFTVFAPYENPDIVITVLVESGGEGSEAASPVAKEVLKWWAENRIKK